MASTPFTARFDEALVYASRLHSAQTRKGTGVPYVAHLLGVASIALEHGADEDEAIAALLHDAIEDQSNGGRTRAEILERFGARVLAVVEGCTDAEGEPGVAKPPWRARKEAYVQHVGTAPASTRLVSAADKLHNARALLADYHAVADALWDRFSGSKKGTLWYYRALVEAFRRADAADETRDLSLLVEELDRVVTELERIVDASGGTATTMRP